MCDHRLGPLEDHAALRQPIEEGCAVVSRARYTVRFPARFTFAAAMNPCPCGYLGDPARGCGYTCDKARRYQGRLSGPLLDRIDLHVEILRPFGPLCRIGRPGH